MPIPKKIVNFLNNGKVKYQLIKHRTVFTASDKAATLKVPEKIVGKTLVLKLNSDPIIVLIPANKNLDKQKLKKISKAKEINFLNEVWIKKNLKGVKIGAIPPFGKLWKLPTFLDRGLIKNSKIIVNAGDNNWSIKINPTAFKKLIPDLIIGNFSKTKK